MKFTSIHCAKSVRIRSYSGSYFPSFGLNTERYGVIQSKCRKIRTTITPNTDTFSAVILFDVSEGLLTVKPPNVMI